MSDLDHLARTRLDHIERQLEALFPGRYVSFGAAAATGLPPGVIELVRAGRKVAAIQAYREATGAGLADAKRIVDSLH